MILLSLKLPCMTDVSLAKDMVPPIDHCTQALKALCLDTTTLAALTKVVKEHTNLRQLSPSIPLYASITHNYLARTRPFAIMIDVRFRY